VTGSNDQRGIGNVNGDNSSSTVTVNTATAHDWCRRRSISRRGRMLDNVAVALAGSSAERVILGEHTSGGESDNDNAVSIAMK
jgi:ATP-dependent Zn protease